MEANDAMNNNYKLRYLYTNLHLKILLSKGANEIAPESLKVTFNKLCH